MSALKAFEAFRKGNTDYLFVMDEYGGFSGILSIRDLIEEIVGELSAVTAEEEEISPQENGVWIAGGSVNIDDAIRILELDSLGGGDHPDYHTLAGFILSIAEEIPRPGARFMYKTFEFKILDMDGNRINRVQITRRSEELGGRSYPQPNSIFFANFHDFSPKTQAPRISAPLYRWRSFMAIFHAKDNTLKSIFGDNLLFAQFLHDLVPIDILKGVRPEDITDLSERFLPLFQEGRDSDTVKRINLSGSPPLFVIAIVEHESKVNFRTPFKMLQYITLVLNEYEKEEEKNDRGASQRKGFKYPPVLPLVFYDGKHNWTAEKNFLHRTALHEVFEKYIPKFEYELIDLHRFKVEDIAQFNDALSFILLIDRVDIEGADKETLLRAIPEGYLEQIGLRIPEGMGKLLSDAVTVLMSRVRVAPEVIREVTDYVEKKEYQTMFERLLEDIDKVMAAKDKAEAKIQVFEQEKLTAIRKLRELGVSEEIIAASFPQGTSFGGTNHGETKAAAKF
jgi:hypothetical protein